MRAFQDRKAFVTGGASGIGLGVVKALARRGAFVVIADIRTDHIDAALGQIREEGLAGNVAALTLDVTDRSAFAAVAERMDIELGGIDILVNSAGVGVEGPVLQAGYADWDFGLGVNLGGVINGLQSFLPQMIAHGRGGHIVNTASLAACVTMPSSFAIFAASKAAVLNLSENLHADLAGKGIGISVLCPAFAQPDIRADWMAPDTVGHLVAEGILAGDLHIIPNGEFRDRTRERTEALLAATPEAAFQY